MPASTCTIATHGSRAPSVSRLKREARAHAAQLGHALGRYHTEATDQADGRPEYHLAFCRGCGRAVGVSQGRWAPRFVGGPGLRDVCPAPVAIDQTEDLGDGSEEA